MRWLVSKESLFRTGGDETYGANEYFVTENRIFSYVSHLEEPWFSSDLEDWTNVSLDAQLSGKIDYILAGRFETEQELVDVLIDELRMEEVPISSRTLDAYYAYTAIPLKDGEADKIESMLRTYSKLQKFILDRMEDTPVATVVTTKPIVSIEYKTVKML